MPRIDTLLKLIASAIIPVAVLELCLSPFWFARVFTGHDWLPTTQLLFTGLFLPLYLAIIGARFVSRCAGISAFFAIAILLCSELFAVFLDYSVWGVSTGMFWHPDSETIMLLTFVGEVALVIALAPPIITLLFRYAHYLRRRKA